MTVRYCSGFYIRVYLHMHEHTTAGKEVTNIQEHSKYVINPPLGGYKIETFWELFFFLILASVSQVVTPLQRQQETHMP